MDWPKPVPQSARVPQRSCRHDWTPRCARPTTPAISAVVPRHRPPLPSLRHIRAPTLLRSRLAIRRRSGACGWIVRCDGHDANTAALPGSILTSFASLPGDAPRSRMPHHPNGQQDSARQGERRSGASVKLRGVLATGSISPTDETKQRQFHEQTHAANVPSGMEDSEHFNAVLDRLIQRRDIDRRETHEPPPPGRTRLHQATDCRRKVRLSDRKRRRAGMRPPRYAE